MAASKKKVLEELAEVKHVGPAVAEQLYDELEVRSVQDLIAAAQRNDLQKIKGIGAKKEKTILEAAESIASAAPKATSPEKAAKAKSPDKAASKPAKKKNGASAGKGSTSRPTSTAGDGQRRSQASGYRPPSRDSRPSIPGLLFKLTKKIIGRLLR